jgi:hypothetical protein
MPSWAVSTVLDYECVVGEVAISLHIDTETQTVQQTAKAGLVTEVGTYSDGVYGPVSRTGAAGVLIPPVHQFVLITEEVIQYGAELRGTRDTAMLDRRSLVLTVPNGASGWCLQGNTILGPLRPN